MGGRRIATAKLHNTRPSSPPLPRQPECEARQVLLKEALAAAVQAVQPANCLAGVLHRLPVEGRTVVIAVGKAATAMAAAAQSILGDGIEGLVLTRYGHGGGIVLPPSFEIIEAAHPVPDARGEAAAGRVLALARGLRAEDRLIVLISGGGSALLALPATGISLADKQAVNRALLASGATVSEMNCVRKHLSAIKGGRLALAAAPARIETYCISDVAGDDPAVIASGPTVPDAATLEEARAVLARYAINPPAAVLTALADPRNALPPPDHPAFAGAVVQVVARPLDALAEAARIVAAHGYEAVILGDSIEGEAASLGAAHAALALGYRARSGRHALISGGECTVRLKGPGGEGGPNGEYLLALALGLASCPGVFALAADTDGIDGNGDNAGAVIDPSTLARARAVGLDLAEALASNRSYEAFAALGDLVTTGPTLTNVNDLRIILVDGAKGSPR